MVLTALKTHSKRGLYPSVAAYIEGHGKGEASWFCWLGLHSLQSSSTWWLLTLVLPLILESASRAPVWTNGSIGILQDFSKGRDRRDTQSGGTLSPASFSCPPGRFLNCGTTDSSELGLEPEVTTTQPRHLTTIEEEDRVGKEWSQGTVDVTSVYKAG